MELLVNSSANRIPLPDGSVHCVVTSPPFWGLRDYGLMPMVWGGDEGCRHEWGDVLPGKPGNIDGGLAFTGTGAPATRLPRLIEVGRGTSSAGRFCNLCDAWLGCLGNEPTPDLYVQHLVEIFREVRRVLRPDGTCWLNLGDSYAASGYSHHRNTGGLTRERGGRQKHSHVLGLKPKDMVGIPWMVAFALRADGWWLRSDVIWAKNNPMPESVTDRPTKSHEYLFLLSRSAQYYYDAAAVREGTKVYHRPAGGYDNNRGIGEGAGGQDGRRALGFKNRDVITVGRNRRTVWMFPTAQYRGAHFAVYPPALVEPCIEAGTSEHGCCPQCGAPWERVMERETVREIARARGREPKVLPKYAAREVYTGNTCGVSVAGNQQKVPNITTLGWRPTCDCYRTRNLRKRVQQDAIVTRINKAKAWLKAEPLSVYDPADVQVMKHDLFDTIEVLELIAWSARVLSSDAPTIPAIVLDPFVGSGTTLVVARALGRSGIGLDLSFSYLKDQATPRLVLDQLRSWGVRPRPGDGDPLATLPLFAKE